MSRYYKCNMSNGYCGCDEEYIIVDENHNYEFNTIYDMACDEYVYNDYDNRYADFIEEDGYDYDVCEEEYANQISDNSIINEISEVDFNKILKEEPDYEVHYY